MLPVVASRRLTPARVLSFLFANLVWLAPLFLAPATNASAQDTFTVSVTTDDFSGTFTNLNGTAANCPANNPGGSGACSLRDAITAANADANPVIIDMSGVTGTITLADPLPAIFPTTANTITIGGSGVGNLTVSGANAYQVFLITDGAATFHDFTVANGNVVAVSGTFGPNNGCACDPGLGGGIYQYSTAGSLTLNNMVISSNFGALGGGGVVATGNFTVTMTTFSNNTAPGTSIAGAAYVVGASNTISTSTFSGNTGYEGSAIFLSNFNPTATLTISDSTFANNTEPNSGSGAILTESGTTLTIQTSTLWNNTSSITTPLGGAINNGGTLIVTDSVEGNPGDSAGTQECYSAGAANGAGCPATGDGKGNITAPSTFNLAPLGFYGGPTETLLPLSGSAAICGGLAADYPGYNTGTDQRGFPPNLCGGTTNVNAGSVQTNYLVVNSASDSDDGSCTVSKCTLRDAINAANTAGNADVSFDTSINGDTLTLTSNLPEVTAAGSVNIAGNGAGTFTIDGAGKYQPFWIQAATTASISGLTLQHSYNSTNGGGVGYAGAILDYGTLSVSSVDFLNNAAGTITTAGEGAAILNASNGSALNITDSYFANNTITGVAGGGAVLSGGPLTITGSTFANNTTSGAGTSGGAVYVTGYSLTISNSTFENNTADAGAGFGGGIYGAGSITVANSTFANNIASDGTSIYNDGPSFSIDNSILDTAAACDGANPCPTVTDASTGNVVGTTTPVVGSVGNNGGSIPTALPVGASICGGNTTLVPGGIGSYTDERGDTGADPHCGAGLMDSGAVQSDYTGIDFSNTNYAAISDSPIIDPSVLVYVYEFGNSTPATSAGGVPITIDLTGVGTVDGGATASTVAGVGATFSALTITATGTQGISAAIPGSTVTAATATITFTTGTTTTTTPAAAAVPFSATAQNVTLTAKVTPTAVSEGNVTFTVCTTATNPCTGTVIGSATVSGTVAGGNASVSYALPAGLAVGTYTIDAQYIDGSSGTYASSKGTATLKVTNVTIAPTTLTAITVGAAMATQTLVASGGTGPYTYAVTLGALPLGISLSPSGVTAGQLTGTATEGGSVPFTVTATDSLGATGLQAYTWTVNPPTITLTPVSGNLAVTTHVAFTQTFTASGGTSPYTYVEAGALPTGLTWTAGTATIAGTTTVAPGSYPITITATDHSTGTGSPYNSGAIAYTLVVGSPTITITPATLTAITVGAAMPTQTLVASGGTGPYTYAVTTPALPLGILLSAAGALTGTATQGGSIGFTVMATDSNGNTGVKAYTWTVNPPTITLAPPAGNLAVTTHIAFTQTFTASGGTSPYTYVEAGALPTGLTWTAGTATIAGTTTVAPGSYPITITATDHSTGTGSPYNSGAIAYTLVVGSPTITITPATLTAITVGAAMPTQTLVASGGTGPYTYAVTTPALPLGISLSTAGALTGTATQGGSIGFTVMATDSNGNTGVKAYTWTVNPPTITLAPPAGNLPVAAETAYSQVFTASGGTAPYTYVESGALPTGLTWTAGTGTIAGTATQSGSFPILISATDHSTGTGSPYNSGAIAYTLVVSAPTITMTPAAGPLTTTVGAAYTQAFVASGGVGPFTYTQTGTLPAGITFAGNTLSGTPTAGGSFPGIIVTAKDADGFTYAQTYTLTVNAPTITLAPPAGNIAVTAEAAFTQAFTASGGTSPYTYVEAGTLPTGLTWTAGTATIAGTATQSGSFPITITATDHSTGTGPYSSGAIAYTLVVTGPTITMTPPAGALTATVATAYTQAFVASGGVGPFTYTQTGTLPAGITFAGNTLSGTPTAGGSFPGIIVTAKDADGFTYAQTYTLTVNAPTITLAPPAGNIAVTAEAAFTQAFTASGGTSPYTYVEAGTLPTGLTWTAGTATIAGTATQSGSFPITITATDHSTGTGPYSSGAIAYTLVVTGPTITIAPAALPAATAAVAYSQQLTATGGTGTFTWSETGGLPAGVTFTTAGLLAGTPTQAGSFPITVTAKDGDNFTGTASLTLTVAGPVLVVTPAALPAASTYVAYTQTFTATGGTPAYTWSETGALPTGVTWNAATATISGTPTVSGDFPITITVTDHTTGTGSPFSKTVGYTLAVSAPTITISPTTLPAATIAVAYTQSVTATGGTGPYTYSVTTGALPAGLALSTAGAITGTPTAGGSFSFTVTAKDSGSFTGTQNYTLTVNAPTITLAPPAGPLSIATETAYSQTFTASGGTAPYTYTESGALPAGLTFTNGVLSGTATASGTFPITITAKDSSTGTGPYSSAAIAYTLNVGTTSISITWANPSAITYGTNLSAVLDATVIYNGNPVPGTFVYTATPTGGSAATVTATTVLAAGSYTLTANFTPTGSAYAPPPAKSVPLTVNQAQPTITWTPATSIAYGTNLSALLNATAAFNSTAVAGSFAYTATPTGGSAASVTGTTVLMEGAYTLTATFTPTDTTDFKTATANSSLTVTGATLTVSAANASRVYGTANPTFTGTITGQQNGDTFTESFTTTATTLSNVGTYPIVPSAAGANLSDYTVVVDDGTLTVTQAASTTALAVNSTSISPGATLTLTATVASATTGTPSGTVSFYDGTTLLDTATLAGGIATYSTTTLAAGSSNSLTAVYSGDANFTGSSTTAPIIVTVGGLDFTIAASPASQNGLSGTTFTYQVAVAPAFAGQPYPGQVTFLVTGLPPGAAATLTPSTVAVGAGATTVTMSIATAASSAAVQPLSTGRKLIPVALAFLLLPLAGTRRMRRQGRRFGQMVCLLLLALGGIVATTALSGCGSSNGTGFNNPGKGTLYTIAIKATSGTVSHSTTVTLTLQ